MHFTTFSDQYGAFCRQKDKIVKKYMYVCHICLRNIHIYVYTYMYTYFCICNYTHVYIYVYAHCGGHCRATTDACNAKDLPSIWEVPWYSCEAEEFLPTLPPLSPIHPSQPRKNT